MSNFEQNFRKSRIIIGSFDLANATNLTVFLGFYNGDGYFKQILKELKEQEDQNFNLLVVDNNSVDFTWDLMQNMLSFFPNRIKIVKNPLNVGGAGTIALNYDLIETEWWCAFHQDDSYNKDFTKHFNSRISCASNQTISISADMGSISKSGKKNAVPPRISWFVKNSNPVSAFLSNVRVQTVPYPATAFKTSVYEACVSPWHSATFSDTETTLKMCANGVFEFTNRITMKYRENDMSESRSINNFESKFGVGASLIRVFSSKEFLQIAEAIEPQFRASFMNSLNNSIDSRLGQSEFSKFIKLIASENCMIVWKYDETSSINFVAKYFVDVGSSFTPELLSRITSFIDNSNQRLQDSPTTSTQQFLASFLNTHDENVYENYRSRSNARKIYDGIMKFMPYRFQKKIGTCLMNIRLFRNPGHPWNIN